MVKKFTEEEKKIQGKRLKDIRNALGYSRKELAETLWMESDEDVKSLELGKTFIKGPIKQLLALKFGVRVEYITLGVGDFFTNKPSQKPHRAKVAAEIEPGDPDKKKRVAENNKRSTVVSYPHHNTLMNDIEGWLVQRNSAYSANQFEWFRGYLEDNRPDFREYLKKRGNKSIQNGSG